MDCLPTYQLCIAGKLASFAVTRGFHDAPTQEQAELELRSPSIVKLVGAVDPPQRPRFKQVCRLGMCVSYGFTCRPDYSVCVVILPSTDQPDEVYVIKRANVSYVEFYSIISVRVGGTVIPLNSLQPVTGVV